MDPTTREQPLSWDRQPLRPELVCGSREGHERSGRHSFVRLLESKSSLSDRFGDRRLGPGVDRTVNLFAVRMTIGGALQLPRHCYVCTYGTEPRRVITFDCRPLPNPYRM